MILESAASARRGRGEGDLSGDGTSVGVLHSDDFSSLRPGYWVVFSGQYDSQSAARDALPRPQAASAYARHVVPK